MMKVTQGKNDNVYENIYTRELFIVNESVTKTIDGVTYVEATQVGTTRTGMVRKESLSKIPRG